MAKKDDTGAKGDADDDAGDETKAAGGKAVVRFSIPAKRKSDSPRLESTADNITVGVSRSNDLVLDDPVASDEHCSLFFRDGQFHAEDRSSATGSYLNGLSLQGPVPIKDGDSLVLGVSRITFKVVEGDAGSTLEMSLGEKSFYFVEKGKPAKGGKPRTLADLYQWVRSEVIFGRSKVLTWGNFIAAGLTIALLAAAFTSVAREPLTDPGDLHASHQMLFKERTSEQTRFINASYPGALALAEADGCATCHTPFQGTPADKCAQCHGDIVSRFQHPGLSDSLKDDPEGWWSERGCVECHTDHTRADAWEFIPSLRETKASCDECHREETNPSDLGSITPIAPIALDRTTLVAYDSFSHQDHLMRPNGGEAVPCSYCHIPADADTGGATRATLGRDFAPADYDVCASCHIVDRIDTGINSAYRPSTPQTYELDWHGTDQGPEKCTQCHASVNHEDLATVTLERSLNQLFSLPNRFSHREFIPGHDGFAEQYEGLLDCTKCHRDGDVTPSEISAQPFLHGLHLSELQPESADRAMELSMLADGECLTCHSAISSANTLEGDAFAGAKDNCSKCHREGDPMEFAGGSVEAIAVRFPHAVHVKAFGDAKSLEMGCYACHQFTQTDLFSAEVSTTREASTCIECHGQHDNLGGLEKSCVDCHEIKEGERDPSYWNEPIKKAWPSASTFDHFSSGHAPDPKTDRSQSDGCVKCHTLDNLNKASTIREVEIPNEAQQSCRKCHVEGKQRFHWR